MSIRLALLSGLVAGLSLAAEPQPTLVSVRKIWDAGRHNAFTDLIRWHDRWYCTFREADDHVGGDGTLRVLESRDGETWESAAVIAEPGIDLRDPKLSITPDDRLMITAGGSVYEGKKLVGRQPRVVFSKDAREWTKPRRVLEEGEWLWRTTWHGGRAYGVSYNAAARATAAAKEAAETGRVEPGPADWKLRLVTSTDGVDWKLLTHLDVPGHPNETTLRFLPDGELVAMVRREAGNTFGWIGRSRPPFREWTWKETSHRFGGPNLIRLPDGSLWGGSRLYPGGKDRTRTTLVRITADGDYTPSLTLPSGGDNSYPGFVWHDGRLWMSYYSSHEGRTSIYLAEIAVPLAAEPIGSRLEPFVDEHLIDRLTGSARLQVQQPQARDVAIVADAPWEGNTSAYFVIFRDADRYRLYYRGTHWDEAEKKPAHREVTCYAESTDGLRFTKPELGLFDFGGSKANNIVWDGEGAHCFTPFRDTNPNCPPDSRYKALTWVKGGLLAMGSADGIHWRKLADAPVITKGAFDSQNLAFFDERLGRYREYHRAFRVVRDIMTGTSDDFLTWTEPQFLDYPHAPPEHLYTNTVRPCPGAPHILIGFPTRFLPATNHTEPTFMSSRDGLTFRRFMDAVIPETAPTDRAGNRSNYMAWGVVERPEEPSAMSVYALEAYYTGPGTRLRRFTFRRDGFVAVTADDAGGDLLTRPLTFTGSTLQLNLLPRAGGSVRVELQDSAGAPLPGFTLSESVPITGDHLAAAAAWTSGADVASLRGRPIRIRLVLTRADVFAFRFAE